MPFRIVRNDITRVSADAIVNSANPKPVVGSGTDTAIYKAAGMEKLLQERRKIGDIAVGSAAVTPAFDLDARYIIHTVGPVWRGGEKGEEELLRSCYTESMKLAVELSCESVAFPLISAGNYGFPADVALRAATSAIFDFLMENEIEVLLVVYGRRAFDTSSRMFPDVKEYVDEAYVRENSPREHRRRRPYRREITEREFFAQEALVTEIRQSIDDMLDGVGKTFSEHLMDLIIEKDVRNSEVYRGANLSKQLFSKMISNKNYTPKKPTACALALSLHLDVDETNELLEKAGMVLSSSSKFDIMIRYFLENKMYNVVANNIQLYQRGLPMMGEKPVKKTPKTKAETK